MSLVSIKNLTVAFPVKNELKRVVSQVSFNIEKSSCLGLVGESGSGKTLTALAMMQLLPLAARVDMKSEIWFSGVNLLDQTEQHMRRYRGSRIGMIFQDAMAAFNPVLTIAEQMNEVLSQRCMNKKMRRERALTLLDKMGIKEVERCYRAYPHQHSGGMRQRAMMAMALLPEPELIIADEPTTALDVTIQAQVLELLQSLREKEHLTLIFITHNLSMVSQIADQVVVMQQCKVVEHNDARQFFQAPQQAYSKKLLAAVLPLQVRQTDHEPDTTLLRVHGLKVHFPTKAGNWWPTRRIIKAVDGVAFNASAGKTLAIVGESGSGKTTLAKAIIHLLKPTAGSIYLNNTERYLRREMQMIFQDPYGSLNPRCMVGDSIAEGMKAQKLYPSNAEPFAIVDELLQNVGLSPECKWRYPHEFSGGEKQRICIARAIALRPKLLILDEPTSALDVSIQMQILQLLEALQKKYNISYLLITHDLGVVAYLAHDVLIMNEGRIVEQGKAASILQHPQQAYTQKLLSALPRIRKE